MYKIAINSNSKKSKLYTILLVILPVLQQYKVLPLEFLDILCLVFIIPALIHVINNRSGLPFVLFYLYCIFSTVFSGMIYGSDSLISIGLSAFRLAAIYLSIFSYARETFDIEFGAKFYKSISFLLSAIVIIQYFVYALFRVPTFFLVPNVTLNYGNGMNSTYLIQRLQSSVFGGYIFRPSAVFIEPADFGYFIIPAIILMLYDNNRDRTWKAFAYPVFISIAGVLTTSTIALISIIIIWMMFFYDSEKRNRGKISIRFLFGLIFAIAVGIIVLRSDSVMFSFNRKVLQFQNLDSGTSSSTALRLIRGWLYFTNMKFPINIVGCGFGKLADYYNAVGMRLAIDTTLNNLSYMNSAFSVLCSEGVIGACLYYFSYRRFFKSNYLVIRRLALLLFITMFGGSVMDSGSYYLIIAFLLSGTGLISSGELHREYSNENV